MTVQARDSVRFRNKRWELLGRNGPVLFDPEKYALEPIGLTSANHRGFWCLYSIRDNVLYIEKIHLTIFDETGTASNVPRILGRLPKVERQFDRMVAYPPLAHLASESDKRIFQLSYDRISTRLNISVALLLGCGDVKSADGLPRSRFFELTSRNVYELFLTEGEVTTEYDRSSAIAAIRESYLALPWNDPARYRVGEQIDSELHLAYNRRP